MKAVYVRTMMLLLCTLFASACEKNTWLEEDATKVIIDERMFFEATGDEYNLSDVKLNGNTLEITVRYGGGCGQVEARLLAGPVLYTYPPIQQLRLVFQDNDPCEAYLQKTFHFDLSPLRNIGGSEIILSLDGWPDRIHY